MASASCESTLRSASVRLAEHRLGPVGGRLRGPPNEARRHPGLLVGAHGHSGAQRSPESLSASFELQGSAQTGEMVLISPIGTTLARLEWTPQRARLVQGSHQLESSSLQKLGAHLTGTELPIAALFEWLAGRTAEAPGWQVDLSAHAQGRIAAERRLPAPGALLRIVLDR